MEQQKQKVPQWTVKWQTKYTEATMSATSDDMTEMMELFDYRCKESITSKVVLYKDKEIYSEWESK